MLKASELFEFPESLPFSEIFRPELAPWEWLPLIKKALGEFVYTESQTEKPCGLHIEGDVYIHPKVKLPPFGLIQGPAYIGEGCELRPGIFIRGNLIAGQDCVLGNSCEFKNSLLLDGVQVPHFSYVGDSILGNGAHLGAAEVGAADGVACGGTPGCAGVAGGGVVGAVEERRAARGGASRARGRAARRHRRERLPAAAAARAAARAPPEEDGRRGRRR